MTSVDDILFDKELELHCFTNDMNKIITDKYGDVKRFIVKTHNGNSSWYIFTKNGFIMRSERSIYRRFMEMKFSYSFLFGIKCALTSADDFNYDLYNKYKDVISADEKALTEEKDAVILQKETELSDLQKKYLELEEKFKKEQQKNEILEDLYQNQIRGTASQGITCFKYETLKDLFNEQSKEIMKLTKEVELAKKLRKFTENLHQTEIKKLSAEIEELKMSSVESEEVKNPDTDCVICYEKTDTHFICTPCNHVFRIHEHCLIRARRCPMCNQETITREQVYLV